MRRSDDGVSEAVGGDGPTGTGRALVGNDVVDLAAPAARGKAADGRFLRRVFTAAEIDRIRAAADPERMLWTLWAAKEAAFKVVRKLRADLPFALRRLEVWPDGQEEGGAGGPATGRVRLHGRPVAGLDWLPVEWRVTRQLVHCVARHERRRPATVLAAVAGRGAGALAAGMLTTDAAGDDAGLTPRERDGARTPESRRVRRLAKALARRAGLGLVEVVRPRLGGLLGPPRLYAAAAALPLAGWDLSLSHDGRFVAAALAGER